MSAERGLNARETARTANGFDALRSLVFYLLLMLITRLWALPSFVIGAVLPLKTRNFFIMGIYCRLVMWCAWYVAGLRWQVEGNRKTGLTFCKVSPVQRIGFCGC